MNPEFEGPFPLLRRIDGLAEAAVRDHDEVATSPLAVDQVIFVKTCLGNLQAMDAPGSLTAANHTTD